MKEAKFQINGAISIPNNAKEEHDADGNIVGYILPNGDIVRVAMSLEVQRNNSFKYVTKTKQMDKIGFSSLFYEKLEFYPL